MAGSTITSKLPASTPPVLVQERSLTVKHYSLEQKSKTFIKGIAPDFVEPTISINDPCLAAETFYNALLGFYDDFVCLDRIRNRGITKNVDNKLDQAKDLFNRILRKTACPLLV